MSARPTDSRPDDGLPEGLTPFVVALMAVMERIGFAVLTLDDVADYLKCSRRKVESMKAAGKLPRPDFHVGRMPRWKLETIRRWSDELARGQGACL
jgi:hypothetical protein